MIVVVIILVAALVALIYGLTVEFFVNPGS
jgi:hypothetical protein